MTDESVFFKNIGLFLGGIILMTFMFAFFIAPTYENKIEILGEAICLEEFNMTYDYMYGEVLHCKPILKQYDGLKVQDYTKGVYYE